MSEKVKNEGESFSAVPSKRIQNLVTYSSWAIALIGSYLAQGNGNRVPGSFTELILRLKLPACVIGWSSAYVWLCKAIKKYGGKAAQGSFTGYPGWSYFCGMVHGSGMLSVMFALAVRSYMAENAGNFGFWSFLHAPWSNSSSSFWLEQVHCGIIGYLLKDYTLYPGGLETGYIVHHLASIVGCIMCLYFPMGAGLITLNGYQSEFASAIFSLSTVLPSPVLKMAYFVSMAVSNSFGFYLAREVWRYPIPLSPYRLMYAFLATLIITLRWAGFGIELKAFLSQPGSDSKLKKTD